MKQKVLFWLIDNIDRWWVAVPLLFVALALASSDIILVPVLGIALAGAVGFFYALSYVDTKAEKENING